MGLSDEPASSRKAGEFTEKRDSLEHVENKWTKGAFEQLKKPWRQLCHYAETP